MTILVEKSLEILNSNLHSWHETRCVKSRSKIPSINVAPRLVVTILNIAWSTFQQIGGNTATRHCLSSIGTDNSRGNVTLLGVAVNLLKDHAYSWRSIRIKWSQWTVREYLAFRMRIRSVSSNITTSRPID